MPVILGDRQLSEPLTSERMPEGKIIIHSHKRLFFELIENILIYIHRSFYIDHIHNKIQILIT